MSRYIGRTLALAAALVWPLFGQLHLITGSPNPDEMPPGEYESAVFRMKADGSLARAATIVPAEVGSEWIVESQRMRKMVIGQRFPKPIVVFDFDKVAMVKQCNNPDDIHWSPLERWLVDSPARGPILALEGGNTLQGGLQQHLLGMVLDPSVACDKSFAVMDPGRLHLYDATTEQVRTITTNQGDSEVLLVDGQTIYYRASDKLYSAAFTPTGFGEPHLLVKAEAIRDAHWAFMKR